MTKTYTITEAQRGLLEDLACRGPRPLFEMVRNLVPCESEPVAWQMRNTAYRGNHYEYYTTEDAAKDRQADFNRSVDDGGLHDLRPLYTHPQAAPVQEPNSDQEALK